MLSIIIVNYNGLRFLQDCLSSIERFVDTPHEVIIVDNASSDKSVEFIAKNFPCVRLVASPENLGFSGGNNLGAKKAVGDLILLLNNDTRLLTPLSKAVAEFERDERIGALSCRMYFNDMRFQPSWGYEHLPLRVILTWSGLSRFTSSKMFCEVEMSESFYQTRQNVDWATGAFLMTRKKLWDSLNGLDEKYFMYVEDADFCKRVRMSGYNVVYTPEVEIVHYRGGGRAWGGAGALVSQMSSYIVYTDKFHGVLQTLLLRAALAPIMAMRSIAYAVLSVVAPSGDMKEKRTAFFKAALRLVGIC
ncbi:MAG: glycosyltransferase family 2 protein [Deltaproteobacteria bacterium]|nr:glycosyltransferase family 2 protein [Deltaproteobacteria bacterium]